MSRPQFEVHTGLWRYFNGPSSSQLIYTLTNAQALAILAFLGALIAFAQNRWWMFYTLYLDSFSLWKLSWQKAIRSLLGQRGSPRAVTMITVSPWLGIISILNIITFAVAEALIPYYLTGSGAAPIVQLRSDIYALRALSVSPVIVDEFYRTCWFNTTDVDGKCGRELTIMHTRPQLSILRDLTCPFPGDVCMPSIPAVQIEHTNLLPVDFGINIKPYFRFSHRVTCSPIQLGFFLIPDQHYQGIRNSSLLWFGADPAPLHDTTWIRASHGRFLRTQNGPNNFSQEFSGRSAFDRFAGNEDDLSGLETYPDSLFNPRWEKIHPHLQRLDGTSFVGIFGAGQSIYAHPINDPLYSAHRFIFDMRKEYIPDHEATGLGCVEQVQFCVNEPHGICSKWSAVDNWDGLNNMGTDLMSKFRSLGIEQLVTFIQLKKSLLGYLTSRDGTNKLISSWQRKMASGETVVATDDQWILEVVAWMETTLLRARADFFDGRLTTPWLLSHNADYVNIDFVGFAVTVSTIFLLCALSYAEQILQYYRLAKSKITVVFISWVIITKNRDY